LRSLALRSRRPGSYPVAKPTQLGTAQRRPLQVAAGRDLSLRIAPRDV